MKILLLSPTERPINGGIAVWTKNYLNGPVKLKNDVTVVSTTYIEGEKEELYVTNKIKLYKKLFIILNKILKSQNFDVAHINSCCAFPGVIRDILFVKLIKCYGIPVILHCHCDVAYFTSTKISTIACKYLFGLSEQIICMNSSSINRVRTIANKSSVYLPNPIDSDVMSIIPEIKKHIKKIIYIGFINREKGSYEILKIAEKFPNYHFMMVGMQEEQVSEQAENQKLHNITFTGRLPHNEVINMLKDSDVLLFPSHAEGFPMTVLEAMTIGVPIVATKVGAIEDMVCQKNKEFLCDVADVNGMVEAIKKLQDYDLRKQIVIENQQKVLNEYTQFRVAESLEKIYREVLER